jgi:hypothetical protein
VRAATDIGMGRVRHLLLAACCCGLMLTSPARAAEGDWRLSRFAPQAADHSAVRGQNDELTLEELTGTAGMLDNPLADFTSGPFDEITIEDLGNLEGPFASQFPELPPEINPFYHGVETDRASFTPALSTASVGNVILEAGYSFIANRHLPSQHSIPELVIRYGMTDRIEARFGWNEVLGGGGTIISPVQQEEGLVAPPKVRPVIAYVNRFMGGFKLRLIDQYGWIPANTVLVEGYFPSYGDTKKKEISATYVVGWEFSPRWKLNASLRYATESEKRDDWGIWCPAIVLKAPFAERWTAQIESFGVIPQGQAGGLPQYFAGPGVQVLLTPEIELNLRVGTGLNSVSPEFYLSAGFGVTF